MRNQITRRSAIAQALAISAGAIAPPTVALAAEAKSDPHVRWERERAEALRRMGDCYEQAAAIEVNLPKIEVPPVGAWFETKNDAGEVVERKFYGSEGVFQAIRQFRQIWERPPQWAAAKIAEERTSHRAHMAALAEIERLKIDSGSAALRGEGERLCNLAIEIEMKIETTPAATFEGFAVQIRQLNQVAEDCEITTDMPLMRNILAFTERQGGAA